MQQRELMLQRAKPFNVLAKTVVMILEHQGKRPNIDASSYVAPNAMICGDVTIGKNVRIMFGAQIIAENSAIVIGDNCIVMENAVIRGTYHNPTTIGNNCLIGPNAHLASCTLKDNVFVATGAAIFHGAVLHEGAEVRVNAIVHLRSEVPANTSVPIHWVAVGSPAKLFSPDQHEQVWDIQKPLDFPQVAYGISRNENESLMPRICEVMSARLSKHKNDKEISTT
jgi:carbonic anhydrase/acetyltransferase-like protein (isoleucine patch superfamily)